MAWSCPICGWSEQSEGGATPERCPACGAPATAEPAAGVNKDAQPRGTRAENGVTRRGFFESAAIAAGLGATAVASYIVYKYVQPAAPLEAAAEQVLDLPAAYPEGRIFVQAAKAFVERRGSRLRCLSAVCTHLGCIVEWRERENLYHCPCHNSDFSAEGERLAGPASRPLPLLRLSLDAAGRLVVHRETFLQRGQEWLDIG